MEILMGLLGASLALVAVFILYIGAAAAVLRLVDRLRPEASRPTQAPRGPLPTP